MNHSMTQLEYYFIPLQSVKDRYHIEKFPQKITNLSNRYIMQKTSAHTTTQNIAGADRTAYKIIENYDRYANNYLSDINSLFDQFREVLPILKRLVLSGKEEEKKVFVDKYLTSLDKKILSSYVNPQIYFIALKHYVISKIYLTKLINGIKLDLIEKLEQLGPNDIDTENIDKEEFKLTLFASFEQILVTAALSPENREDLDFISKYEQLVNKYANVIATKYAEEYLEEMQNINKLVLEKKSYNKLMKVLGA